LLQLSAEGLAAVSEVELNRRWKASLRRAGLAAAAIHADLAAVSEAELNQRSYTISASRPRPVFPARVMFASRLADTSLCCAVPTITIGLTSELAVSQLLLTGRLSRRTTASEPRRRSASTQSMRGTLDHSGTLPSAPVGLHNEECISSDQQTFQFRMRLERRG